MTAVPVIDIRQAWRTPRALFDAFHCRYRFDVDAAADASNKLLPKHWTIRNDGVAQLLARENNELRAWVNPPYDDIGPWIIACRHRCDSGRGFSALLLPSRTDQKWFHEHALAGVVLFSRGRVQFEPPPGVTPSSNNCGSVLVVFDPETMHQGIVGSFDAKTGEIDL